MATRSGDDGHGARDARPTAPDRRVDVARMRWALVQAVANIAWPLAACVTVVRYVGGMGIEESALFAVTLAWRPVDAVRMAFEMGALYLSALMLAFGWIVVVRPFASGLVRGWSWRQRGTYAWMALAQGVFLGPGWADAVLFGWVLLRGVGTEVGPPGPLAWVGTWRRWGRSRATSCAGWGAPPWWRREGAGAGGAERAAAIEAGSRRRARRDLRHRWADARYRLRVTRPSAWAAAGGADAVIEIVPVAEHHAEGFRSCLDVVARERRYLAQVEAPPLERIEAFVRESVANDATQFMAVDGDRVVGWADVLPAWAHAVAHVGSLGMGVLPAYRGRGVGRRLLEACIAKAWAQGITRIELEVRVDNERAIGLYRSFGFVQEAVKRRAMRFDGVYFDALLMSLLKDAA